jgi:peroxiredoxin
MAASDTIAAQVDAMWASRPPRPQGAPPNAYELDRARFLAEWDPARLLPVGSPISDVELVGPDGRALTLHSAIGDKTAVLVFYRGEWCPYCSIALRTYEQQLVPALQDFDAKLIAVSPQRPDGSLTASESNDLSFLVLSDPGNRLARLLGIVVTPSDDALELQRSRGLDIAERNGDGTVELPMPTVAIVDAGRALRWVDVHPDYATRTEVADVLDALEAL